MHTRNRFFQFFIVCLYLFSGSAHPAPQRYEEYAIKTAFLYRSLHYVEWSTINGNKNHISICIQKPDKFSETIHSLNKRKVNGRTISVTNIASYDDAMECNVLYIPAEKPAVVKQILRQFQNSNILTISDRRGFADYGVILNFPVVNHKVVIEVNVDAANKQSIRFSAKLLRIAEIIGD